MANGNELTVYEPQMMALTLDETVRLGTLFAESGFFSDAKGAAQAVVKIIQGQELGVGPMVAMRNVYVIPGKGGTSIEISAGLMAALLRRAGYDYRVKTLDKERCTIGVIRAGQELGTASFTIDDAKSAGLAGRSNWSAFAEDMLFARAMSRAVRRFAPEVLMGNLYVEGEVSAAVELSEPPETTIDTTAREIPGNGTAKNAPDPEHWIKNDKVRARFWAWTGDLGLSHDDVHTALGVEHVADFDGDMHAAKSRIEEWVQQQAADTDDYPDDEPEPQDARRPFVPPQVDIGIKEPPDEGLPF